MAKERKKGRVLEENPNVTPAETPAEIGGPEVVSLFDASGDTRVRIQRRDERTQKLVTQGYFPSNATEEDVSRVLGGGDYQAQLLMMDESGREIIKQSHRFKVPGAYKEPAEMVGIRKDATPGSPAAAPVPSGGAHNMGEMLNATMLTAFMDMVKTMKETVNKPPAGPDPMLLKMMETQGQMQMKLMELMIVSSGSKGDSKKDMLEMIASIKELFPPAAPGAAAPDPAAFMKNIAEMIKSVRDVSDDLAPDRPDSTDPMAYLPKLAEVIVEQNNKERAARTRRLPRPASPASPVAAAAGEEPPQVTGPAWERIIKAQGPLLLKQAQADRDPQWAAQSALTLAPENLVPAITEFFNVPTQEVVGRIFTAVPGMQTYPEWTAEFAFWGRVELGFEEEPEEGEEQPEHGDGEGLPEGAVQPGQEE